MSIIGLDIGGSKMSGGLVRHKHLSKVINQLTNTQAGPKETIKQITDLIDSLINQQVQGIGIGMPGTLDVESGLIFEAVNLPALNRIALKKILEKKYKLPVYINNDANCFALGEKYFGQAKGYNNIAGVTLGTGMGTGLIINGELYSGHSGAAGEFGQIDYRDGVLEHYSSGQFFQRKYKTSGEKLFPKKDKKSRQIFEEFGYHLGKALSIIVYAVDPEIIILGGSISKTFKLFEKSMKQSLKESSYHISYKQLKIVQSKHPYIALLGAAWLAKL
jgi:glucokinase